MAAGRAAPVDFGPLAEGYDRLRPVDENWRELFEVLVEEGDLAGRRVLDVGCGTGRLTAALAEAGARAWGVDPSPAMVERARHAAGSAAGIKVGAAESLPFKDAWFERAIMRLVVHHVDRARALPEAARVLAPGGRLLIATFDPAHFTEFWLNRYFPSIAEIDSGRFPTPTMLADDLRTSGFATVRSRPLTQREVVSRERALEKIRGRYISTLTLLDEQEFVAGLARAERELPPLSENVLQWTIVVGERP